MTSKTAIIDDLGETALLLPARLNQALVANDQAKYCFGLLQNALTCADHPEYDMDSLASERQEVGIDDPALDAFVESARRAGEGYVVPGIAALRERLLALLGVMIEPLRLAADGGAGNAELNDFETRLAAHAGIAGNGDSVTAAEVAALTRGTRGGGDSLHLLVMDLHKVLNRLQTQLAEAHVDGASVYRLAAGHRPLVAAFMAGVNRTSALKFGHPGLGTTATSIDRRLVLQNDIGTTDAHVFVVNVEGRQASLVYTDVHRPRLEFFRTLLDGFAVEWHDTDSHTVLGFEHDDYYLCRGVFQAGDDGELERYLAHLGSRLVFLIDWNKARKRLRELVRKRDAVRLLKWAADHDCGHRAFLELGGEQMIFRAIEHAAMGEPHYGQPLYAILGQEHTQEFLKYALRTATEGMLEGRNWRLIEDQIRSEMLHYFRSVPQEQLAIAARHAEFVFEAADLVRSTLQQARLPAPDDAFIAGALQRAASWERDADVLVNQVRGMALRAAARGRLRDLVEEQDDAVDALEDSVFLATLFAAHAHALPPELLEHLTRLAEEVCVAGQEFNKAMESAQHVHRGGAREDMEDFFHAFERVVELEHRTDSSERAITRCLASLDADFGIAHLAARLTENLEGAVDTLSHCAHRLRDYLVEEVMAA